MGLYLYKLWNYFPFRLKLFNIFSFKIGDAYGFCLTFLIGFFKLSVSCKPVSGGLVDIEKIHVIHTKAFQSFIYRVFIFIFAWPELGGKKDFFSCHTAIFDPATHSTLIYICICSIDQTVANLQSFSNTVLCIRR